MKNDVEELAKTLFINAMKDAKGLGSISEDELKDGLKMVTELCFVAAQIFYTVAKENN